MTIIEALKLSKKSGGKKTYMRVHGGGGFCTYVEGYTYTFEVNDLLADDWEDVTTGIPKLTGGRWNAADAP
jgi:hypothetical protein